MKKQFSLFLVLPAIFFTFISFYIWYKNPTDMVYSLGLLPLLSMVLLIYQRVYGTWFTGFASHMVQFADGPVGRLIGRPHKIGGKFIQMMVSVDTAYTRGIQVERLQRGTGCSIIRVVQPAHRIDTLDGKHCSCPEGVIRVHANIDGSKAEEGWIENRLLDKMERYEHELSQYETTLEAVYTQALGLAKQHLLDLDEASDIGKKIADKIKRVIIVPKGGAGDAAISNALEDDQSAG